MYLPATQSLTEFLHVVISSECSGRLNKYASPCLPHKQTSEESNWSDVMLLLSDASKVRMLRYVDPVMGPRQIPLLDKPEQGKTALSRTDIFVVDLTKNQLALQQNGTTIDVGTQFVYLVDCWSAYLVDCWSA